MHQHGAFSLVCEGPLANLQPATNSLDRQRDLSLGLDLGFGFVLGCGLRLGFGLRTLIGSAALRSVLTIQKPFALRSLPPLRLHRDGGGLGRAYTRATHKHVPQPCAPH